MKVVAARDATTDVRTAARLLMDLLTTKPAYRQTWIVHVKRPQSTGLVQAAVARVITDYLWDSGERSDGQTTLARSLRDRVRRALLGDKLTAETLTWFTRAFDMEEADEHRLWAAFAGCGEAQPPGIAHTMTRKRAMVKRQWHRTQTLFERYFLDEDGALALRRTMHAIVALEDGVDSYLFNHERLVERIDVRFGGVLGRR